MAATVPPNLSPSDPGLKTLEEFLHDRNPGGKIHPSDAYEHDLEKLNTDLTLVPRGSATNKSDKYTAFSNDKGVIIYKKDDGHDHVAGVLHDGTLYTTKDHRIPSVFNYYGLGSVLNLEWKNKKLVKYPSEYVSLVSDVAADNKKKYPVLLKNLLVDGEALQVRAKRKPREDAGETLAVLNEKGQRVAQASDEWGATLLVVAKEYRGKKLGVQLGKLWYGFNPSYSSGGFTPQGQSNAVRIWESRVQEFLTNGWYSELVRQGQMTKDRVLAIRSGLRSKQPEQVEKPKADEQKSDVLVFIDDPKEPVSFIIYDAKFLAEPEDKHIFAHGFFRSSENIGTFLFKIDYERQYAKLATYVALQMAKQNGEPIYIGEGYGDLLELDGLENVKVTGDYVYLTKDVLPLAALARKEKAARKAADQYDQLYYSLVEQADSKWS